MNCFFRLPEQLLWLMFVTPVAWSQSLPQLLEAARVLAQRTSNLNLSEDQKLERVFRLVLCRKANENEMKMLKAYYLQEKNKFIQHKDRAEAFLKAGEFEQIKTKNIAETAALMQVNQMIFNLDETTVK
jgi:hypothetical protein